MVWAAIGAAAIGVVGGYINQKNAAKAQRSSSGQSGYDPNVTAGSNQAIQTAQDVANRPWSGISEDQAVAGLTPNQIAAQQSAGALGEQLPGLDATATQGFNQGNLQKYMNPYERDVLDVQKQFATRDYLEANARQGSKDVLTSAFGGDRNAISHNQLDNNYTMNLENIQKTGLRDAFNFGVGAFNQDRGYASNEGAAIRGALSSTGGVAQATNQLRGNFRAGQFNEQRDWTKNQNAYLTQILGNVPKGSFYSGSQTAMTQPAGGGWGGALAGAAQIVGAGGWGGGGGQNYGMGPGGAYGAFGSAAGARDNTSAGSDMGGGISSAYAGSQGGAPDGGFGGGDMLLPVGTPGIDSGAIPVGG